MGESGCGKSTLGRMITRLLPASSGTVLYDGTDLLDIPQRKMLPYRRRIQMLFQHPDTSLNPRMTVLDSLREPFLLHDLPGKQDMDEIIRAHIEPYGIQPELLERGPPKSAAARSSALCWHASCCSSLSLLYWMSPLLCWMCRYRPRSWICYTRFSSEPEYRILPHLPRCLDLLQPTRSAGLASVPGKAAGTRGDRGRTECPYPPLYPGTD